MKTPLDDIVRKSDHLIMSEEGANGFGQCYESDFHLSDAQYQRNKSDIAAVDSQYFHGFDDKGFPIFFHGHTLVNWGIFMPSSSFDARNVEKYCGCDQSGIFT